MSPVAREWACYQRTYYAAEIPSRTAELNPD